MRKLFISLSWVTGLLIFLVILSFLATPGSLKKYESTYLDFSYPLSWEITEFKAKFPGVLATGQIVSEKLFEPFIDNENLIQFNFPVKWLIEQESFPGNEIVKHIQLISPDKKNVCLIQIWHYNKPLRQFINDIKAAPIKGDQVQNFLVTETNIKGRKGYLVEYKHGKVICKEFYFLHQNYVYRISYLYAGSKWTQEQESNFHTILQSIIVKNN
ncbi:MAG: hypothetical protein PWQ67_886 [Clostridia bacterium]|nr:hypothetical protein [Clostridia bacterium]MDN5322432.1 hypothetical protein [Clostridia bacterium]